VKTVVVVLGGDELVGKAVAVEIKNNRINHISEI
jgi:hypothetical protein